MMFDDAVEVVREKMAHDLFDEEYFRALGAMYDAWDERRVQSINKAVLGTNAKYVPKETLYIMTDALIPSFWVVQRSVLEQGVIHRGW